VSLLAWLIETSAEPVPEPSPGYKILMAETPLISANRLISQLIDPTHVLAKNNQFSKWFAAMPYVELTIL